MRWMNLEPIYTVKLEREKQISYTNAYLWNLERWYWWTYLQDKNGDAETEQRLVDTGVGRGRKERVGQIEGAAWKNILPYAK